MKAQDQDKFVLRFPGAADQFPLRLPDGMREAIKAEAKANGRSMNAEIISRLTTSQAPTLRDQFAMQALNGIIPDCGLSADEMAERCFEAADAMLRVRAKVTP
jgi:plasmid stability protein